MPGRPRGPLPPSRPLWHGMGVRESPNWSPAGAPVPTHPSLGVAVAGADDGSRLLDHLQDGSPVDIPRDIGVIRAHDPARRGTQELAHPLLCPQPGSWCSHPEALPSPYQISCWAISPR